MAYLRKGNYVIFCSHNKLIQFIQSTSGTLAYVDLTNLYQS